MFPKPKYITISKLKTPVYEGETGMTFIRGVPIPSAPASHPLKRPFGIDILPDPVIVLWTDFRIFEILWASSFADWTV